MIAKEKLDAKYHELLVTRHALEVQLKQTDEKIQALMNMWAFVLETETEVNKFRDFLTQGKRDIDGSNNHQPQGSSA